ncbi:hypothetical protein K440DRAFT_623223 [Wilcoxina mikolae CBS 423.85]|nr:hypothetical protein K440DRAFT_623223 [Wilcoxina mikolae CBS 423.85]
MNLPNPPWIHITQLYPLKSLSSSSSSSLTLRFTPRPRRAAALSLHRMYLPHETGINTQVCDNRLAAVAFALGICIRYYRLISQEKPYGRQLRPENDNC